MVEIILYLVAPLFGRWPWRHMPALLLRPLLYGRLPPRTAWFGLTGSEVALSLRPYHRPHPPNLAPGGKRWVLIRKLPNALSRKANSAANLRKAHKFLGHGGDHRRNPCVIARVCYSFPLRYH